MEQIIRVGYHNFSTMVIKGKDLNHEICWGEKVGKISALNPYNMRYEACSAVEKDEQITIYYVKSEKIDDYIDVEKDAVDEFLAKHPNKTFFYYIYNSYYDLIGIAIYDKVEERPLRYTILQDGVQLSISRQQSRKKQERL